MAKRTVNLASAPTAYNLRDQEQLRQALQEADRRNQKTDEEYEPARFIMKDSVDGKRYSLTIVGGVLTLTEVV